MKLSQRQIASKTSLSAGTVNRDAKAGADLSSIEGYLEWRRKRKQCQSSRRRGSRVAASPDANAEPSRVEEPGVEMIHLEKAISIFREFTLPLKRELERLPVLARARCNPSDPALAEGVLKSEIKSILTRISTFEGNLEK